jgi:hypothetical protein
MPGRCIWSAGKLEVNESLAGELRRSAAILHEQSQVKEIAGKESGGAGPEDGARLPVQGVFIELGPRGWWSWPARFSPAG